MGKGARYEHVERLLKAESGSGKRVLELGCGGAAYRDLFDDYTGTDLPSTGYEGEVDAYADARRLPFAEKSFDLVFIQAALYLIPSPGEACREAFRVLRDGGRFLVFDYPRHIHLKNMRKNMLLGNYDHRRTFWGYSGLKRLMEESGFADVRYLACRASGPAERLISLFPGALYPLLSARTNWLCLGGSR